MTNNFRVNASDHGNAAVILAGIGVFFAAIGLIVVACIAFAILGAWIGGMLLTILAWFFPGVVPVVAAALGLTVWQLGVSLGILGGFVRAIQVNNAK